MIGAGIFALVRIIRRQRPKAAKAAQPQASQAAAPIVSQPLTVQAPDPVPIIVTADLSLFAGIPFSEITSLEIGEMSLSKKGKRVLIALVPGERPRETVPRGHSEPSPPGPLTAMIAPKYGCKNCSSTFATEEEARQHEEGNLYHIVQPLVRADLGP